MGNAAVDWEIWRFLSTRMHSKLSKLPIGPDAHPARHSVHFNRNRNGVLDFIGGMVYGQKEAATRAQMFFVFFFTDPIVCLERQKQGCLLVARAERVTAGNFALSPFLHPNATQWKNAAIQIFNLSNQPATQSANQQRGMEGTTNPFPLVVCCLASKIANASRFYAHHIPTSLQTSLQTSSSSSSTTMKNHNNETRTTTTRTTKNRIQQQK